MCILSVLNKIPACVLWHFGGQVRDLCGKEKTSKIAMIREDSINYSNLKDESMIADYIKKNTSTMSDG